MDVFLINCRLAAGSCPKDCLTEDLYIIKNHMCRTLKECSEYTGLSYGVCRKLLHNSNAYMYRSNRPLQPEITIERLRVDHTSSGAAQ